MGKRIADGYGSVFCTVGHIFGKEDVASSTFCTGHKQSVKELETMCILNIKRLKNKCWGVGDDCVWRKPFYSLTNRLERFVGFFD